MLCYQEVSTPIMKLIRDENIVTFLNQTHPQHKDLLYYINVYYILRSSYIRDKKDDFKEYVVLWG